MLEQKIGQEPILNNAAEKALKKAYVDFIVKEKLEVIGQPKVEIKNLKEGEELKFQAVVDVMPEVSISENFRKGVKKINEELGGKKPEIKEEEINLELEKLANSRVKLVTVLREAQKNDSVEIDFTVRIGGVPIENGTSKNHPLIIGRGVFIPGFEENIIGMKEGEEKTFELNFPGDYHKKDLAGKPATFEVKMNLVQERQTPEINDDFAKSLGDFADLSALKKSITEGLEHEMGHKMEHEKKGKYLDEIIKETKVDVPETLIESEIDNLMQEFEYQIQSMGMNLDDYLEKLKKDKSELRKDWISQAEKRATAALVMKELAKILEIKIPSEKIEEEMNKTLQYYKNVKDFSKQIDLERLYGYTKGMMENEEVFKELEKI
jgi:trigger factor